jgi:hypothetical protein
MLQLFLEIWYALPIGWRRLLIVLPIIASVVVAIVTLEWLAVVPGLILSFVLWILPGASEAEKKGYHF